MSPANHPDAALSAERVLSSSPREVFAAFEQPDQLARWWGPKGFTNTFERFEFEPGGQWVFVMHGPDGANYRNESIFRTRLAWVQEFESPEAAAKLRALVGTANEQNLDRLEALLAREDH